MTLSRSGLEPELEAFLKYPRIEQTIPVQARVRALARARMLLSSRRGMAAAPLVPVPEARTAPVASGRTRRWVAAAAALLIAGGAVGAVAALREYRRPAAGRAPEIQPVAPTAAPSHRGVRTLSAAPEVPVAPAAPVAARPTREAARADLVRAELHLMQRAHAAYKRTDYPAALALLAIHARKFPHGSLAEQREALRVRSLGGAGRTDEARRATAAFAARFPRSVLLSRLDGTESATP